MRKKTNNRNLMILILIILLLALAVGYAVFSETLTISGTANAKGTFDLEFQNAEIIKNIGADAEKTTAEISADKNTLTVNVADLSYPGAGVEFSVDIVNLGTLPATIQAITPNNITGNDKIKVTGLEEIKVEHPKIESGDRCNMHFTVEWPVETGEILENESSISFGLQIEYTQASVEIFKGEVSHIDTDKYGNTINTNTVAGGEIEEPIIEGVLTEIIKPEDYGKNINYKATVKGVQVSNWKVLYNDKSNIYLILDDFLPSILVPTAAGLDTSGTYVVNSQTSRDTLLKGLTTSSYWSEFANGIEGATATGAPKFDILMKSYNEKYGTSLNTDSTINSEEIIILDKMDTLYVPHTSTYSGIGLYWLADAWPGHSRHVWYVNYNGHVRYYDYNFSDAGIRPVVKLPGTVEGIVGETVEIK